MQRPAGVLSTQATTGDAYQDLRIQLLAFLKLYKIKVEIDGSTTTGMAKQGFQALGNLFSSATGASKTKSEVLDTAYTSAQSEIDLCKTDEDWLKLVRKLREFAVEAQKQKSADGLSRLSENLDALASIVVAHLRKLPWYQARITNLINEYKKINDPVDGEIFNNHANSQGKGVADLNTRSRDILRHLAEECNPWALSVVMQHERDEKKLILAAPPPPQIVQKYSTLRLNFANPLIYQISYANVLFDQQYRLMEPVGRVYEDFLNNAIVEFLKSGANAAPVTNAPATSATTNGAAPQGQGSVPAAGQTLPVTPLSQNAGHAPAAGVAAPLAKPLVPETAAPQSVAAHTLFPPPPAPPVVKQGLNVREDYIASSPPPSPSAP